MSEEEEPIKSNNTEIFYNNRYLNQHASANEPEELYDSPASTIVKRRQERAQIRRMYGRDPPDSRIATLTNILRVQTDILKKNAELVDIFNERNPIGKVFGYNWTYLSGVTNFVTHLDFVEPNNTENLPVGTNIEMPNSPLFQTTLRVDTGAIKFSFNADLNNTSTAVILTSGEKQDFLFQTPEIRTMNIAVTSSPANIRVIGLA
jgi:hypothetical protein